TGGMFGTTIGPLQYDEIDVGDPDPVRCLNNGLWLAQARKLPFAVLFSPAVMHGIPGGVHVEIAVPAGEEGTRFSEGFLRDLERQAGAGRTYRGKVISLEGFQHFSGLGGAVKVHRLRSVAREDVILPARTLLLLDRNIGKF